MTSAARQTARCLSPLQVAQIRREAHWEAPARLQPQPKAVLPLQLARGVSRAEICAGAWQQRHVGLSAQCQQHSWQLPHCCWCVPDQSVLEQPGFDGKVREDAETHVAASGTASGSSTCPGWWERSSQSQVAPCTLMQRRVPGLAALELSELHDRVHKHEKVHAGGSQLRMRAGWPVLSPGPASHFLQCCQECSD